MAEPKCGACGSMELECAERDFPGFSEKVTVLMCSHCGVVLGVVTTQAAERGRKSCLEQIESCARTLEQLALKSGLPVARVLRRT